MDWVEEHDAMTSSVAEKSKVSVTRHGFDLIKKKNVEKELNDLAEQQQSVLQSFFDNLHVHDAEDEDECGGVRLLLKQMMKAFGQRYSVHHLIWEPSAAGLSLKTSFVPLWFFENTQGRMRFIGDSGLSADGVSFDELGGDSAWMVSKGRGASLAGMACYMFANLPLLDWVTYCSRHGMPGFLGKSNGQPDSKEWQSMVSAIYSMSSEFSAVVSGQDSVEVLDLTANGQAPYPPLIEMMHRLLAILWRGADLSTMSKGAGVGASVQDDETAALDEDNAVWLSETVNRHITKRVIAWHFGEDAPVLVDFEVRTAQRDDQKLALRVFGELADRGVQIPISHVNERFQIPEAGEDEECLGVKENGERKKEKGRDDESETDAAETDETAVLNSASDREALLENALADLVGVTPETLRPVAEVLQDLEKAAADEDLDYEGFLDAADELVLTLPEYFEPSNTALLVEALEAAMGTAAVQGVRESLTNDEL
ncbi:phage portal protein family protein [Rubritalea sp.]|uniref:phage portal protein family protein n=1 Tax=Rubritalea sp. TaxID=2109375 RepID=UPI003EF7AA96